MITRRRLLLAAGVLPFFSGCASRAAATSGQYRVVVVGGGFAGATCARYLRRFIPQARITLIEPNRRFTTCPFSNAVIAGHRPIESITIGYAALRALGVEVVHDVVDRVDTESRRVRTRAGDLMFGYDRLVVAPGIDFRWDVIEGYGPAQSEHLPHAWKAGEQTRLLRRQLHSMGDGGLVVITVPTTPFRGPAAPYERASLIADWLRRHKRRSKVVILDANEQFPKQQLFTAGWKDLYPGTIEWVRGSAGGKVEFVDAAARRVLTNTGAVGKAAVLNVIPPQRAGALGARIGVADDTGWCPVNPRSFESTLRPLVHVIGDAALAGELPKSAFAASSEAKACAAAIALQLDGLDVTAPSFITACYSLLAEDYAISDAAVFKATEAGIVAVDAVQTADAPPVRRVDHRREAQFARGAYDSLVNDSFGANPGTA